MSTLNERLDEIIEEFEGLDDWMDRYSVIIDMGNEHASARRIVEDRRQPD